MHVQQSREKKEKEEMENAALHPEHFHGNPYGLYICCDDNIIGLASIMKMQA